MLLPNFALLLLPCFARGFNITFPVTFSQGALPVIFSLNGTQNPVAALRRFCTETYSSNDVCDQVKNYLLGRLRLLDASRLDDMLCGHEDDIVLRTTGCIDSSLVWGITRLYIDLSQLGSSRSSAELVLPAFAFNIDSQLQQFCIEHKLSGQRCRQLDHEVFNYVSGLYERPKGATLANMFDGMYYDSDIALFHTFVDLVVSPTNVLRHYFVGHPLHFIIGLDEFCCKRVLDRVAYTAVTEHIAQQIVAYYGHDSGELAGMLYVMRAVNSIVEHKQRAPSGVTDGTHVDDEPDYVDADFIEIGTSNFNTLTQLVDGADGLVGFAVEPSLHYLAALPDKPLITKVNCAIVAAPIDGSPPVEMVDLYYVPEDVISEHNLPWFVKGCNSIGRYHPVHVTFGIQQHVQIDKVLAYTVSQFLSMHRIRRVRLLKIDAEGYDVVIMEELHHHLLAQNNTLLYPERIVFETNEPAQAPIVQDLIVKFVGLGYEVVLSGADDTILEYIPVFGAQSE